jgi:hypothetical protein
MFGGPLPTSAQRRVAGEIAPEECGEALVVFVDECGLKWLQRLRRGYRHCFVAVRSGTSWVICDPLSHRTDLTVVGDFSTRQLADWYRSPGLMVVQTHVLPAPLRPAPIRPYTCVEAVKRVLGMHAPWILTPWQLYRQLYRSETQQRLTSDFK